MNAMSLMTASVTRPPALRITGASPGSTPRKPAGSTRSSGYRSGAHRQRHRQQAHPGRKRAVAPDELNVLGYQEDESEQGEERHRDRAAGRAESHVAE